VDRENLNQQQDFKRLGYLMYMHLCLILAAMAGDAAMKYFAEALPTNQSLTSLSLGGIHQIILLSRQSDGNGGLRCNCNGSFKQFHSEVVALAWYDLFTILI
jgi:hypothetical protein